MSNNNSEIKILRKRGRPSKKVILEELEIITTNDSIHVPETEIKKKYQVANLTKARETRKNNIIHLQESKQQHVHEIINILQNNELTKLNEKYAKLESKMLKLIK
jgi:hypothetical protein